jgi:hypothetical protein
MIFGKYKQIENELETKAVFAIKTFPLSHGLPAGSVPAVASTSLQRWFTVSPLSHGLPTAVA